MTQPSRESRACTDCGAAITWQSQRCRTCGMRKFQADKRDAELRYEGEWVLVKGVRRPVMPAPRLVRSRVKTTRVPIVHGTDTGYSRHRKLGEDACDACLEAHRLMWHLRRAKRAS